MIWINPELKKNSFRFMRFLVKNRLSLNSNKRYLPLPIYRPHQILIVNFYLLLHLLIQGCLHLYLIICHPQTICLLRLKIYLHLQSVYLLLHHHLVICLLPHEQLAQ